MNPFMKGAIPSVNHTHANMFKEYAWDFEKDTFITDDKGKLKIVTGNEAIKVWVYKTLRTQRYRYKAYFDDYGLDLEKYEGKVPNNPDAADELFNDIVDTLLVNIAILEVHDIKVEQVNKRIRLQIALKTIFGATTVGIEV